jgi:hypothetical protein
MSLTTFWIGRLVTLGIFYCKYVVHLTRRSGVFATIYKPLRPDDGVHRLHDTLTKQADDLYGQDGQISLPYPMSPVSHEDRHGVRFKWRGSLHDG